MLIFDCEIINGVLRENEEPIPGINYCEGWHDHAGMGISVVGVFDSSTGRSRVFCEDNRDELAKLIAERAYVMGWNNHRFDDPLLAACWGIEIPEWKSLDLCAEVKRATGDPDWQYLRGFSLDATAQVNGYHGKTDEAWMAPVCWQRGQIGRVIDYCLADVHLTSMLLSDALNRGDLLAPGREDHSINMGELVRRIRGDG